uniref:ARAD1D32978p n=1 Tax=Blastobotrys adeninivorans TaxID=409370 RepID=A0A060THP9_BLAAD
MSREVASIKKGPSALKFVHKINAVARSPVIPIPTSRQNEATQRFFESCNVQLSRVVSDPAAIDGLTRMPEVAFMGRSNVGKSSLLNALLYPQTSRGVVTNKVFAKVANHPGYTKTLNFFTCGRQLRVVDMPGYGYGSRTEQGELITTYLQHQHSLRRVYVLVSAKEGLTALDEMVLQLLEQYGISWQLVYTKLDKMVHKPVVIKEDGSKPTKNGRLSLLDKLSRTKPKKPTKSAGKKMVSKEDTDAINQKIQEGLELVTTMESDHYKKGHPTVYEEVIGTSSTKMMNYLGIPQLRASIMRACGLLRKQ